MKLSFHKRLLALFLPALLACCFCITVYAHAGRTDDNGGHTDYDTGEYHYHHGYPAHAHYDMDGDGVIDCPYDFDDQTNHNTSNSTGSGTSTLGNGDPYISGYSDGYDKGYIDGAENGYTVGYSNAEAAAKKQLIETKAKVRNTTLFLTLLSSSVIFSIVALSMSRTYRKRLLSTENELSQANLNHKNKIDALKESFELDVQSLSKRHDKEISNLITFHNSIEKKQRDSANATINTWKERYQQEKKKNTLLLATFQKDASLLDLPEDVTLEPFFTPVKGYPSKEYPYGEYTVFLAKSGRRYHSHPDCASNSLPYHYFDIITSCEPCAKCVKPGAFPNTLPVWTAHLRKHTDTTDSIIQE